MAGHTPLEAQNYLNNIWQRIRAKLDREGIRIYGFRVAEPNHDGTPHWHLLIFVNVNESKALVEIFHHYALLEDPEEKGAKEHRLTVTKIDPTKGSATGYIAKYISKNIDGSDLEEGFYGVRIQL
nr:replication endonuclease [Hydrogenovibrio marinus]